MSRGVEWLRILRFAWGLVWGASPRLTLACAALSVLGVAAQLGLLFATGRLIDSALDAFPLVGAEPLEAFRRMGGWLAAFVAVMGSSLGISYLKDWADTALAEALRASVSEQVQTRVNSLSYQTMQSPRFRKLAFRAAQGRERPVALFSSSLSLFESLLSFVSLSVWLGGLAWWLPLLVVVAGLPLLAARVARSRRSYKLYDEVADDERFVNYYDRVLSMPQYGPEVRLFRLFGYFRQHFESQRASVSGRWIALCRRSAVVGLVASALSTLLSASLFVGIIFLAAAGGLTVGSLAMYLLTVRKAEAAAVAVGNVGVSIHSHSLFVLALYELLTSDFGEPDGKGSVGALFPESFDAIEVRNVVFSYPSSGRKALDGVSLSVRRGEVVGIAGANGCGKSTLVKVMCGLLRPDEGSVTYGNVDAHTLAPDEIGKHVTALFQDFRVYCVSASDNISFGDISRLYADDEAVRSVAQKVGLASLLDRLADGYATRMGDEFEGSEMFSRGEWQLMAFARVLFSKAEVVFLDEPASSLDPRARQVMLRCVEEMRAAGRTVFIVSHLAETLSVADRVVEMR